MKKKILLFVAFLIGGFSYAQTAIGFNYKAIVTDNGAPVANAIITVKVTIKNASTVKWAETHSNVHTDANGIFSITIGEGTRTGGVASFDEMNWNLPTLNMSVSVDTGSGYVDLVTNEYFKSIPYAKQAERLLPATYDVIVQNTSSTNKGFRVDGRKGNIYAGYRLSEGIDDWYIYMNSDKAWAVSNDGSNVLTISDTDNSVWIKGKLKTSISGDADMKAYIYGYIKSDGSIVTTASTTGFSVTRTSTGNYKVSFTTASTPGDDEKYIVVATAQGSYNNIGIDQHNNDFVLYVRDISTNNYVNTAVRFVVYKK